MQDACIIANPLSTFSCSVFGSKIRGHSGSAPIRIAIEAMNSMRLQQSLRSSFKLRCSILAGSF